MPDGFLTVALPDEAATAMLADDIAAILEPGDVVALSGDLGVGKTTLARAAIRAVSDDDALEVPSPTFTLVQTYAGGRMVVAHFDLYRVGSPHELDELGLDEAAASGAVLVEWPERAGDRLPADRLEIHLDMDGAGRRATFSGDATWQRRIARTRAVRALLAAHDWGDAMRRTIAGDASTRRYERVRRGGLGANVMDWPPALTPPRRDSRAAFRAQDVRPVVAVDRALRTAGLSAPRIRGADMENGVLLMEDFGADIIAAGRTPVPERYRTAVEMLAAIHCWPQSAALPVGDGTVHTLLTLSAKVLAADLAIFSEWYVPHVTSAPISESAAESFAAIWDALFARVANTEQSWVLFDVQSPNLFWLPRREGIKRIGLIDFQDMFLGPSAYDVASLCQDARVTVPRDLERSLQRSYLARRRESDPAFDVDAFHAAYAILGTTRLLKIFGVFARLAHLGKTHYLGHFPRLHDYLARNLAHPVLSDLAVWYERHLPPL